MADRQTNTSKMNPPMGGGLRGPDRQQEKLQDQGGGTYGSQFPERLREQNDPDKAIKEAVKDAQHTLTEQRNCEDTVEKLLTALDNNEVAEAILESDEKAKRGTPKTH
jgi:hypothetical protein